MWILRSTILCIISYIKFMRKVTTRTAAQYNKQDYMQFYINLKAYTKDQLVYINESAINKRTLFRKYSYIPKGLPIIDI